MPDFGYKALTEPADIVIRSSPDDVAHSAHQMIPGPHALVEAVDVTRNGPITVHGVSFEAFSTRERLVAQKPDPAENALYRFTLDDIRILHMGDVGTPLQQEHLDRLRDEVDIMLAITGDNYTIALDDLVWAIDRIRPRVVIPMHYQAGNLKLPQGFWFYPLEAFSNRYPDEIVVRTHTSVAQFTRDTLPDDFRIYVLESAG